MAQGEPFSGASEAGDDLVGDQQDVVAIADLADAREVAVGRHDHAARTHDRLGDDGSHRIGAFAQHGLLEGIRRTDARILVALPAIGIGGGRLHEVRHQRPEHLVIGGHAGGAHRRHGDAVIGVGAREDLHLLVLALQLPVVARDLEGGFVRFRAGGGEIDRRAVGIGELDQLFGQTDRGNVGGAGIGRGEGELGHLVARRIGQFLAAMAGIDVPQARQPVDVFLAVGIDQHLALALDQHHGRLMVLGEMQGMDQEAMIGLDERTGC